VPLERHRERGFVARHICSTNVSSDRGRAGASSAGAPRRAAGESTRCAWRERSTGSPSESSGETAGTTATATSWEPRRVEAGRPPPPCRSAVSVRSTTILQSYMPSSRPVTFTDPSPLSSVDPQETTVSASLHSMVKAVRRLALRPPRPRSRLAGLSRGRPWPRSHVQVDSWVTITVLEGSPLACSRPPGHYSAASCRSRNPRRTTCASIARPRWQHDRRRS
jgi:hypothetical protein